MGSEFLGVLLTSALLLMSSGVVAEQPYGKGAGSGVQYYWYDGDVRRTIQLQGQSGKSNNQTGPAVQGESGSKAGSEGAPVFREGGELKTLPGGVIVKFSSAWTAGQVEAWLSEWGFAEYRPLNGRHTWMIESAGGLSALDLANRIHESGEVVYASPNWSVERQRR